MVLYKILRVRGNGDVLIYIVSKIFLWGGEENGLRGGGGVLSSQGSPPPFLCMKPLVTYSGTPQYFR